MNAFSQSNLGTDIMCEEDLDPHLQLSGGVRNVGWALAWRILTDRGSLFYETNYGLGLVRFCHDEVTRHTLSIVKSGIQFESRKDDRILSTKASVRWNTETRHLETTVVCESAVSPFRLVVDVSKASQAVRIL